MIAREFKIKHASFAAAETILAHWSHLRSDRKIVAVAIPSVFLSERNGRFGRNSETLRNFVAADIINGSNPALVCHLTSQSEVHELR